MDQYLTYFDAGFQQTILRYRRWQDAQLSLKGRLLLIKGLEIYDAGRSDISTISFSAYGKPYFAGNPVHFNIAHSGEIAVCVLNKDSETGVDIEYIKPVDVTEFKSQMTDREWLSVTNTPDIVKGFYNYWTIKEAVLKAHGNGLSIPLASFEVNGNRAIVDTDIFYTKEVFIDPAYCCHVAARTDHNNLDAIKTKEIFI